MTWCRICQAEHANPCEFDPARKPELPLPPTTPRVEPYTYVDEDLPGWLLAVIVAFSVSMIFLIGFAAGRETSPDICADRTGVAP